MNVVIPAIKWSAIGPELILSVTAMVLLLLSVLLKKENRKIIPPLSLLGVLLAFGFAVSLWGKAEYAFQGMIALDNYSLFFKIVFLVTTALTILMSIRYLQQEGFDHSEYYILVLFAAVGMMLMASAADLIIVFLGLETSSLSIYVLAGFFRTQAKSNESALKYFLLGSFSTGFLVYGIALIYGATGTTNLKGIFEFFAGLRCSRTPSFSSPWGS